MAESAGVISVDRPVSGVERGREPEFLRNGCAHVSYPWAKRHIALGIRCWTFRRKPTGAARWARPNVQGYQRWIDKHNYGRRSSSEIKGVG